MLVYVNDIFIMGNSSSAMDKFTSTLSSRFVTRDLGPLSFFLGIEELPQPNGNLILSQKHYMIDLLVKENMANCKPVATPMSTTTEDLDSCSAPPDPTLYHWVGSSVDRCSTCGYVVYLGPNLVSWQSKKQRTVACSSTESEYMALANCFVELSWFVSILTELRLPPTRPPVLWCDNPCVTYLSVNPVFHVRTKHIEIDFHFVREKVARKELQIKFISTKDQIADVLTKPLSSSGTSFDYVHDHLLLLRGILDQIVLQ
ncbi:hypothetical protein LIER_40875 [Lithospermum erythrorhizon]|uniref:Reverse transcriptase Ty1/copia-type domain-containing protein n=1 Tax=Lithospermum erythrorhizon TaxID=34254 RepID=A0AAV3R551_LITER